MSVLVPGDLVLFRADKLATPGLFDKAIMRATHSPWVHVGIVARDGRSYISARSDGIQYDHLPGAVAGYISTGDKLVERDYALGWLAGRVHQAYGWGDILNQLLMRLPGTWPTLHFNKSWDCSDLAVHFLVYGRFPFTDGQETLILDSDRVTPADLANALQVEDYSGWQASA